MNARILIVDDEENMRRLLKNILEREEDQCRVALSAGGEEALKQLEAELFDIVLTDVQMPEMNGMQLLAEIKKRYPGVAVVVMTAHTDKHSVKEALVTGADEYIAKPFRVNELIPVLERAYWRASGQRRQNA